MSDSPRMISAPRVCPKCGSEIPSDAPGGDCTFCLLQAGIGGQQETVHDLTPGDHEGGLRFGVYEIDCREDGRLYELGRGAMGVTYRATDTTLQRKVALKIIQTDIAERSADARERFMREARAAAALRHENIATVHQFGTRLETGQYFYAMELIEGETLDERVRRAGPLDARNIIEIAQQVTSALATAEKHGLVHRDLKPANLMLVSPDGETSNNKKLVVKIIDFGLAKAIQTETDPKSLTHDRFVGTPAFASPEQFEHSSLDVRSDIYSLGETLWFALTGKTPFSGRTMAEIRRAQKSNVLPIEQLKAAHVPHRLKSLLESMLALEPASRPSTHELATRLKRCSPEECSVRRTRVALVTAALLLFGMSALFVFRPSRTPNAVLNAAPDKSIAVLPFENLSADPENAFFTDGVQDEILNNLAKIADLKVISRTSVMQYKSGVKRNVREIANALGVAHVVEGSVQRAANRVRVSAQLIDAKTDTHLWVERYDRPLGDVFAIQSEIAKAIAGQLQAKFSPAEKAAIEQPPTTNLVAYDRYLRAEKLWALPTTRLPQDMHEIIRLLDQAVAYDPTFLLAYCELARANAYVYHLRVDHSPARLALAEEARNIALRLGPARAEPHLAAAWVAYHCYRDYEKALAEVGIARRGLPNNASVFSLPAYIARRQGRWEDCIRNLERAVELDPRSVWFLNDIAEVNEQLRRFPEAAAAWDRVLAVVPGDPNTRVRRAVVDLDSHAETQPAYEAIQNVVRNDPSAVDAIAAQWLYVALCRRDAVEISSALASLSPEGIIPYNVRLPRSFCEGLAARTRGDADASEKSFAAARVEMEKIVREQSDDSQALCVLGVIDAALGRKEDALREGRWATELLPVTKDGLAGAQVLANLAITYAWAGEKDLAIKQLEELVRIPSPISYGQLHLHPFWDPLRGDPRFEKLVEEAKLPVALSESEPGSHSGRNFAPVPKKSIAVLPFENRSRDPDNAYFADGVQDEILTRLSKIADLKVISRTSTQHYKNAPENLPEIAQQLGVAHVLEGSVQKSGDTVRVNVQLIKAADDSHLWADTFDRKLTDIFSVESEVAKAVADQLRAKLTGQEEQVVAAKPTENTEAYDSYLRGLAFRQKTTTLATFVAAQQHFREAVRLDPKFAHAWAALSMVDSSGYLTTFLQPTVALREEARQAAETAMTLQPNLGEAVFAKGIYHYGCLKDYDTAIRYLEQARQLLPNDSRVPESLAYVTRRRGQWEQSEKYFNEAERLDPRNVHLLEEHALTYSSLRRFPEALRKLDEALNITPDDVDTIAVKAAIAQAQGDLPRASALLAPLHPGADQKQALETQVYQAILERSPAPIIPKLKEVLAKPAPTVGHINAELRFWLGWAQEVAGDYATAQDTWHQARSELKLFLKEQPQNPFLAGDLALVNMALGDKAAAISFAEKGMLLVPIEKDAVDGPCLIDILARVAAGTGQPDRAIITLQKLLSMPAQSPLAESVPLTPALLRLDPMFDPLRNDPRFQKLCEEKQP